MEISTTQLIDLISNITQLNKTDVDIYRAVIVLADANLSLTKKVLNLQSLVLQVESRLKQVEGENKLIKSEMGWKD